MSPRAIDAKVLAALAAGAATMAALRKDAGIKPDEAKASVQRLRWKGMVEFNRLALTPSQLGNDTNSTEASGPSEAVETSGDPAPEHEDLQCHDKGGDGGSGVAEAGQPLSAAALDEGGVLSSAPPSSPITSAPSESGTLLPPGPAPGEAEVRETPSADAGGGDAVSTSASSPPNLSDADALLGEIAVYCARHQVAETDVGRWALRHAGFVGLLRKRRSLSAESAAIVRAFLVEHPEGIPAGAAPSFDAPRARPGRGAKPAPAPAPAPVVTIAGPASIADQVRREAETSSARRTTARQTGTVRHPLAVKPVSIPEQIQTAMIEGAEDLIKAIHRKHPKLWARVLLLGRATGQHPVVALYAALERGLDQLQTGGN